MNTNENDPDTLELPEEEDPEWVNLWENCRSKKEPIIKQLKFDVIE
jgi:hypothetical protein